jgi:N-glycosylase/DNA lyase
MTQFFPVKDYDLEATLTSGQAFRWEFISGAWEGVVQNRWVRLQSKEDGILAETAREETDWKWLVDYLQVSVDLDAILRTFPKDGPMRASVRACKGLRLLRQDPWECLASFILSSTKQIVQIRQIVALLCERFGCPLPVPSGHAPSYSFPSYEQLAGVTEANLRACKMGFRAPYLLATARMLARGEVALSTLHSLDSGSARVELLKFPGVGRKIADCVLLFAYGFPDAFPVDVWVLKALRSLYFPKRRPAPKRLRKFADSYFGPYSGYAQQYLFHYMRTKRKV